MRRQSEHPHATEIRALFQQLGSAEQGLSDAMATQIRARCGDNSLPLEPPRPAWRRLLAQFHNVLIYVLLLSALLSLLLQHWVDSGVILAVVLINAIVGFIQEGKAEDALRAILSMSTSHCLVMREGRLKSIDSRLLVPGDVVMLQAGDRVPADMRLFVCKDLRCDESALTGEAQPVSKQLHALAPDTTLAERRNMAYMGTLATYGMAQGLVVATGLATQLGEISSMVKRVHIRPTPLQQQLTRFAKQLALGILVFAALAMLFGIWFHQLAPAAMFQAAIGIAVAAIPEGLPAIVTIALAMGVQRMARQRALVRRLPAVEVLGSVDVICSDKTGTLTANAMTARELFSATNSYQISGEGYRPEGAITDRSTGQRVLPEHDACLTRACEIALLCNDATLSHQDEQWSLNGDPTEGSLLVLALKHGQIEQSLAQQWPRIDVLPFESANRYMATLHHNAEGTIRLMVKGAPERLLGFATTQLGNPTVEPLLPSAWEAAMADFAGRGMRVMALAYKELAHRPEVLKAEDVEHNLTLVALVGISDPPRPEAIASIRMCHQAGIRVKMITGDNPVTAAAIGAELGLRVERVLTGQDIDGLTPQQLSETVEQADIFARTSPANKLQLVSALQNNRHVVAMTGDGVNDAPALKKASIGVAMGQKGTDAAKEAADFVLTDDNFSTIAMAVREGRTVYDNILKSIIFILPTNLAEALVIFSAVLFGLMMPITPAQILWVNMITAVTLALALAFEQTEHGIMRRPPRPFGQGLFTPALIVRMLLVGGLGASIVFSLFYAYRVQGATIEYARTIAVNALVMIEVFYLFNCRQLTQSLFHPRSMHGALPALLAAFSVLCLQLAFSYLPVSQQLFGLASISGWDWLLIVSCALPVLVIVELEKAWLRHALKPAPQIPAHGAIHS